MDSVTFSKDSASYSLTNISQGAKTLIPDLLVYPVITDDLGNSYRVATYSGVAPLKNDRGEVQSGTLVVVLSQPIPPEARKIGRASCRERV